MNRFEQLIGTFRRDGWAMKREWAAHAGIGWATLSNSPDTWLPQTKKVLLLSAAQMLAERFRVNVDLSRLTAWLDGAEDLELGDLIDHLGRVRKCTACRELFEPYQMDSPQCRPCRWSPATRAWIKEVDRQIAKAPEWLEEAWLQAQADLSLITLAILATIAGKPVREVQSAWSAAELPRRKAGRPRKTDSPPGLPPTVPRHRLAARRPAAPGGLPAPPPQHSEKALEARAC